LQSDFEEIKGLLVRYVKDETLGPFKNIGRYLAFGLLGSLLVGFGAVMMLLGVLRMLQSLFPVFDGSLSFVPYLVVVFAALGGIGLTAWRIVAGVGAKRLGGSK
jgi:hypothetical protein